MILDFRKECMSLIADVDFKTLSDTSPIDKQIFRMSCVMIVTHTPASYSAAAELHG